MSFHYYIVADLARQKDQELGRAAERALARQQPDEPEPHPRPSTKRRPGLLRPMRFPRLGLPRAH